MSWEYNRRVKYYETDRMGVVHHSNYLRLLEDARMDWLGDNLISYSELEKSGVIIPCVSASGEFLKNPDLHTAPNNQVFKPNCSRYLSDLGFLKTNSMIFSTFSRWSDGGLITKE